MDSIAPLPGTQSLAALAAGDKPARTAEAQSVTPRPVERSRPANAAQNGQEGDEAAIRATIAEFFAENREIHVEVDDPSGRVIFQSLDKETGEVKNQVPSEDIVKLVTQMLNPRGLIVDAKA